MAVARLIYRVAVVSLFIAMTESIHGVLRLNRVGGWSQRRLSALALHGATHERIKSSEFVSDDE